MKTVDERFFSKGSLITKFTSMKFADTQTSKICAKPG